MGENIRESVENKIFTEKTSWIACWCRQKTPRFAEKTVTKPQNLRKFSSFKNFPLYGTCVSHVCNVLPPPPAQEGVRNSVTHSATVMANGLMHFGTTSDVFLRENLDWLKRASNWAKFSATASLGLIHYVSCVCVCVCGWEKGS